MEFTKVDFPSAAPAVCRSCGGASKEYYIDTGHSEEYYGAVYYCNECIAYIASLCGFMTPVIKEQYDKKVSDLENQIFDLRVRLDAYSELENAFAKLGIPLNGSLPGTSDLSDSPSFEPPWARDDMDRSSAQGEDGGDEGKGEESSGSDGAVDESGEHEGMAELRPTEQLDGGTGIVI